MCFFLVLGITPREKAIGTETRLCSCCGRETVHALYERRLWFNLFFVPLFPVSGKQIVARCSQCGFDETTDHAPARRFGVKACPSCGAEVVEEAAYCQYCGHRF